VARVDRGLREQGCTTCSLWVFARNERALRFYRAAGFAQESPVAKTFELSGATIEEVRFVARL
jgi:RimJ/RimL family protein N-acetyltransferase